MKCLLAKTTKMKLERSNQSTNRFPTLTFLICLQNLISFMVLEGEFTGCGIEFTSLVFMALSKIPSMSNPMSFTRIT